mmetsp:Transcript_14874/g.26608  ORF Transcript_14874/g.26608 Transcript_14874/m.26608 type:complete len:257 (-) Transcript_14874:50-820(-)|eukprot:CAMPEP_0196133356 /NCGR_PEP_ID=MMETSP0910-20130528/2611_1 /TAXON_ID=49265 /ORGANISM="Thalassiosira rotula, Strain GSO102" /LENGTH=256 /DNA_ID=CAMNT_0041393071 /DNA_START=60 /DNA_END=830 /DNA_ORIENTATION=+
MTRSTPTHFILTLALAFAAMGSDSFVKAKLAASPRGLLPSKPGKGPPRAVRAITMWWVIIHDPGECMNPPDVGDFLRTLPDIMAAAGGVNPAEISIVHASGGVTDAKGFVRLVSTIYKNAADIETEGTEEGPYVWGGPPMIGAPTTIGFKDDSPEIHLVIRDHGPPEKDPADLITQLTRFIDPFCEALGGANVCIDIGTTAFPGNVNDNTSKRDVDVGPFTAAADLGLGVESGSEATLIRVGDALQVVANINIPFV